MSWCRVLNKESPLSFRAHDARYRLFDPTLYCARPRAHVDRFDTETARRSRTDTHARANNTRHRHEAHAPLSLTHSLRVHAAARAQSSSSSSRSSCVEKCDLKEYADDCEEEACGDSCNLTDLGCLRARLLAAGGHVWQGPGCGSLRPHSRCAHAALQQAHFGLRKMGRCLQRTDVWSPPPTRRATGREVKAPLKARAARRKKL